MDYICSWKKRKEKKKKAKGNDSLLFYHVYSKFLKVN